MPLLLTPDLFSIQLAQSLEHIWPCDTCSNPMVSFSPFQLSIIFYFFQNFTKLQWQIIISVYSKVYRLAGSFFWFWLGSLMYQESAGHQLVQDSFSWDYLALFYVIAHLPVGWLGLILCLRQGCKGDEVDRGMPPNLLLSHWPKEVMCPSPKSLVRGTIKWHRYREVRITTVIRMIKQFIYLSFCLYFFVFA